MARERESKGRRHGEGEPSRGRPKNLEKRRAILRAAEELFLRDGLDATSMDTIAATAGVSKRTVYNHFGSKENLFAKMLIDGEPPPSLRQQVADTADLRHRLREAGIPLLTMISDPESHRFTRLMISEAHRHPEVIERFFRAGPEAMHLDLAAMLRRATEAGQLDVPDPMLAADQLLSMWLGQYHLRMQFGLAEPRSGEQLVEHVDRCLDMFLRAYAPKRSPRL